MKLWTLRLLFLLGLLASSTAPCWSQADNGQISGSVADGTGALLPGTKVTVINTGTNASRTASTATNGTYLVRDLPPAHYRLVFQSAGFQEFSTAADVTVGGHATIDVKLAVGSAGTSIDVAASGPSQINLQTSELSELVSQEQIRTLPSLTRNVYDFVALSGNVSSGDRSSQGQDQNSTGRGVGFSINGQRSSGTEILLDGVENSQLFQATVGIPVPLDSVGEYRVITSNFDPQYGRASGGVVNVITASGTNAFHGVLTEYNRLSDYTANTVTNAQQGIPKGTYTRNQFGFAVGGPIIKNKLFFFAGSEWLRVRSSANVTSAIPTPQLIAASAPNVQAFYAAYGKTSVPFKQTFTISQLSNINQTGALAKAVGVNTPAFGIVNYTVPSDAGGGEPQNTYNYVIRSDYNLSNRTQMFARFVGYNQQIAQGGVTYSPYPQYNIGQATNSSATLFGLTHTFSPSLLATERVSFSRINLQNSFVQDTTTVPTLQVASGTTVAGYTLATPAGNSALGGPQNIIQWNQDLNWTKGAHSAQFGAQILYIQNNYAYAAYGNAGETLGYTASDSFDAFATGILAEFDSAVNPQGKYPGQTITTPLTQPQFSRSNRFHDWAVYAQDSWRMNPRLNISFGLRYEYYGVQHNNNRNLDSNFYYGAGSDFPSQIRSGAVATTPQSPIGGLWKPSYGTLSPRVGFAYDVFGDGKTSLRGGYGISYERNFGQVTFNVIQNPPNYAVVTLFGIPVTNSNLGPLASSGLSIPLPTTSLRVVDPNIRTAQTQFWTLSLERQLNAGTVVGATYAGARGIHLYDIKNTNDTGSGNVLLGDTGTLTRLNKQYSTILSRGSNADSYYEALTLHFQTTNLFHSGLSATANYTYGHAMDDLSSTFGDTNTSGGGYNFGYTQPFNPRFDRGNSDLNIRQRFVLAPIYQTPWFKDSKGLKAQALGGWGITGVYTVRTGASFNFFDSTNDGTGFQIPRYAPSSPIKKWKYTKALSSDNKNNLYTIAANLPAGVPISNPALGGISDWGPYPASTIQRNAFTGPGAWNVDAAVIKKFALTSRVGLEVRAEGFDIFNHHNLYVLSADNDQANYLDGNGAPLPVSILAKKGGVKGSPTEERRFGQFAAKITF